MKNCGFRTFVGWGYDPALNVYLEAMGDKSRAVRMPIPSMVTNVLRNVPSGNHRGNFAAALKWIFSKGLYVATQKRHELAQQASQTMTPDGLTIGQKIQQVGQRMGNPRAEPIVHDHEIYSKQAHEFFAQNGVPELKEFYDNTYGAHPEEYEPDAVRFDAATLLGTSQRNKDGKDVAARAANGLKIPLGELNQLLQSEGKAPFQFGGYNGLIEYMEDGPWAPVRSPTSPTEFEHGARQGFDLSDPKRYVDKRKEGGHIFYRFADFSPPKDDRVYNNAVNQMLRRSSDLINNPDAPHDLPDHEKEELERMRQAGLKPNDYAGSWVKTANLYDFSNRKGAAYEYHNDPDTYALLTLLIHLGVDEEKEFPFSVKSGADPDLVMKSAFPGPMKIGRAYKPRADAKNPNTMDTIINLGAKRLRRLTGATKFQGIEQRSPGHAEVVDVPTGKAPDLSKVHDIIIDLALSGKLGFDEDDFDRGMESLEKSLTDVIEYEDTNRVAAPAEKGNFGHAKVLDYSNARPASEEQIQALLDQGYKVLRSREERQAGIRDDQIPDRDEFKIALGDSVYWVNVDGNNQYWISSTDEHHDERPLPDKYSKSPRPAMFGGTPMRFNAQEPEATPQSKAQMSDVIRQMQADPKRFGYGYGEEGSLGLRSEIKDIDQSAGNAARMAKWRAESMGIPVSALGGTTEEDLKTWALQGLLRHSRSYKFYYGNLDSPRLRNYFASTGVTDPALQDQAIELMREMQKQRMSPDKIDEQMPEEFKPAFAINGKWWRQPKMKDHVIATLRGEMGTERGAGGAGADAEGNEKEDQTLDNNAGRRQDQMNNVASGKAANLRVDPMTGKIISGDIEEAPDVNGSEVVKQAGHLKNAQKPFSKLSEPMINSEANPSQSRIEYNRGHAYSSDRNMPQQMKDRELSMHLMQSLRRLDQGESQPYETGLLDGIGDAVHARVYRYLSNPNREEYPSHTVQMFLKPGGKYYLGNLIPHGSSQISQMQRDIEAVAPAQASEPETQHAHQQGDAQSGPLHPTITVVNPMNSMPITIDTPEDLRHWYDHANQTKNGGLANELRRQAIATGNKDYINIVQPQQTGLGQVGAAPVPQPQQAAPRKFSMDFVPGVATGGGQQMTTPAPAPMPQQAPRPGGLAGRVRKPGAPWPGPNQNEAMETFIEFRLRQARAALSG